MTFTLDQAAERDQLLTKYGIVTSEVSSLNGSFEKGKKVRRAKSRDLGKKREKSSNPYMNLKENASVNVDFDVRKKRIIGKNFKNTTKHRASSVEPKVNLED